MYIGAMSPGRVCLFVCDGRGGWPYGCQDNSDEDVAMCVGRTTLLSTTTVPLDNAHITDLLRNLSDTTATEDNVEEMAERLLNLTAYTRALTGDKITHALGAMESIMETNTSRVSRATVSNIARTINNLLYANKTVLMETKGAMSTASRLRYSVDKLVESVSLDEEEYTDVLPNIAMFAKRINERVIASGLTLTYNGSFGEIFTSEKMRLEYTYQEVENAHYSSLSLPPSVFIPLNRTETRLRVTFVMYKESKLFSDIDRTNIGCKTVNGHVIASSIPTRYVRNLTDPVIITFRHDNRTSGKRHCSYLGTDANGNHSTWSTQGCHLLNQSAEFTVCACNHLTNFALLMDVYGTGCSISEANRVGQKVLSYVGCTFSLVGLILTLLTYLLFKSLRQTIPSKILLNLCAALLGLNLIFLVGVQSYALDSKLGCKVVAVLLHYTLLSVMTWTAVEAFYMYRALVRVMGIHISRCMLKFCLFGWGVPLVIVAITLSVNKTENYGDHTGLICWISSDAFYGAVLAPVCTILVFNSVVFALVMHRLLRRPDVKLQKSARRSVKSQLRGAVGIVILLGLTWLFALFVIKEASDIFRYLFIIFNTLQGMFIFLFHCGLKREARKEWKQTMTRCTSCCTSHNEASGSALEMKDIKTRTNERRNLNA